MFISIILTIQFSVLVWCSFLGNFFNLGETKPDKYSSREKGAKNSSALRGQY